MKIIIYFSLIVLNLALVACSKLYGDTGYIHDRSHAYLSSQNRQPLSMPANLKQTTLTNYYATPAVKGTVLVSMMPPDSQVSQAYAKVPKHKQKLPALHLSTSGVQAQQNKRYLIAKANMEQTWLALAGGLQREKIKLLRVNQQKHQFYILDTFATFDKLTEDTPIYIIQLQPQGSNTKIYIVDPKGQAINSARQQRLLGTVEKAISSSSSLSAKRRAY